MKLTVIFLTVAFLNVSAEGLSQNIRFSGEHVSLREVFAAVEKQTGYVFLYSKAVLNTANPVSVKADNIPLEQFLEGVFTSQPLKFSIKGKIIAISSKATRNADIPVGEAPAPPEFPLHGRIVDEDGRPLAGASISIKGGKASAITDANGQFTLTADAGQVLTISYIGFSPVRIKVNTASSIVVVFAEQPAAGTDEKSISSASLRSGQILISGANGFAIVLSKSTSQLDAVTVNNGYWTSSRRLSTGNVSTIRAADIERQPVNNIIEALAGRVAGLQITPTSGITGAAPNVLIRGKSSAGSATNEPLYMLDGIPVLASQSLFNAGGIDGQSLNLLFGLNIQDIESVSVLKDADATAIYGSRGANGVILITTKRGRANGVKLNVNAYTGFQQVSHFPDLLSVAQYRAMRREAFKNDNKAITATNAPDLLFDSTQHDWQREFLGGKAITNDLNISLSGGSATTHFYLSAAYHREGTVMPGDIESTRKSFQARLDHSSADRKFNINLQASYSLTSINTASQDLTRATTYAPDYQMYNPDGTPNWNVAIYPLSYTLQKYSLPSNNYGLSTTMGYELVKGLRAKLNAGVNISAVDMSLQEPLVSKNPASTSYTSALTLQSLNNNSWTAEPQLEYAKSIGAHHFEVLAGTTFQKTNRKSLILQGSDFANDALLSNIGSAGTKTISSTYTPYAYNAVFGRLSYNYKEKYLLNLTFRRDGSSRFGPDKTFGNFGAVGAGWVFSQEKGISHALPFLSFGKLRGSYGITGNDQIVEFGYISTVSSSSSSSYNGQAVLTQNNPANPDLQWETNKKLEFGLELGLFRDRVYFSGSFFRNRSSNQLVQYLISPQAGFQAYPANFPATVQNMGYEVELTSRNLQGELSWNTSFTFSKSSNKLVAFPNHANSSYSNSLTVGESLTNIKAYKFNGLNSNGLPTFEDLNKNGIIDIKDRIVVGNNDPFYSGINNEFTYKGFALNVFIHYTRYRSFIPYLPNNTPGVGNFNTTAYVLDRWQKPGDEAFTTIPKFTTNALDFNYRSSNTLVITNNIFRLSNVALTYNLPANWIKPARLTKLQVYVKGQNLFVFDKKREYQMDPQTGNTNLPPLRNIVFGINATL